MTNMGTEKTILPNYYPKIFVMISDPNVNILLCQYIKHPGVQVLQINFNVVCDKLQYLSFLEP